MKRGNLFRLLILSVLICVLSVGCAQTDNPGSTAAGTVDNACSLYTPQITEDAFRYLDEIYVEKYPQLGLRWEHGTGADQRIMTAFAQQVTEGCATDREKVTAIFNWIVNNIRYAESSSPISSDVLYRECGNCLGKTLLMQDMCRVLGIPAVYSDGIRGDLKTISVEAMQSGQVEGHAWVFVYVEGAWILYDPTWGTDNVTDWTFIAENFYIDKIGGIKPVYDENAVPPFNDPVGGYCYLNGRFVTMSRGKLDDEYGGSFLNFAINVNAFNHGDEPLASSGVFYWDGPAAFAYVGKGQAELYANGWMGMGDPGFFWGELAYAYENGILASEVVMQYNGDNYLLHGGRAVKLLLPDEAYRMSNGVLLVDASYTGKIWEPCELILPEGDYSYQWYSTDEAVATVDENGVVTCYQPGSTEIGVQITGVGHNGIDEFVWTEDNPIVVFEMINFAQDISRPDKYAVLDAGGPAYIEYAPVERMGFRDIYPVMTDDMLMLFEPVDGVLTLPTAQNANGYFILPETYDSVLQFPLELRLPLAEGYLTLDRETLESFTLVDTGLWGELWYLPLTEEGANVWNSGFGAVTWPDTPPDR